MLHFYGGLNMKNDDTSDIDIHFCQGFGKGIIYAIKVLEKFPEDNPCKKEVINHLWKAVFDDGDYMKKAFPHTFDQG